jgi:hypothetical protein
MVGLVEVGPDDWRLWRELRHKALAEALYLRHGFAYTGEVDGVLSDGVRRDLAMARSLTA